MKIYLASSWRNDFYPSVLKKLIEANFEVHDFRHPYGHFQWSEIDKNWQNWSFSQYLIALQDNRANKGYYRDMGGLDSSDICIILLPCNKSAHLEAGYAKGKGKPVYAIIPEKQEPELMYKLFDGIYTSVEEFIKDFYWR